MPPSSEIKTYLQVLKSKVKTSPYKEVEITGTQIKVRGEKGNPDMLFILNWHTSGNGVYSPEALDMLILNIEADVEAYRIRDAEGWQIANYEADDNLHIRKEVLAKLTEATKYASKDTFRPALCRVHFKNGDIWATDGYKAFITPTGELHKQFNLSPSTIAIVKKCAKYGEWHCVIGHTKNHDNVQMAFNGFLTICDIGVSFDTVPDMRTLLESKDLTTDTVISVPYKQLKEVLASFKSTGGLELALDRDEDYQGEGEIYQMTLDGNHLPLVAKGWSISAKPTKELRILMPRVAKEHFLAIDPNMLKAFPMSSEGNILITFKKDLKSILLVV